MTQEPTIVQADGRPTLAEALDDAMAGAVLVLSAGIHRIEGPLLLGAPITLRGAGRHLTIVAGASADDLLQTNASMTLESLTVRREASDGAVGNTIFVQDGTLEVRDVRIDGATGADGSGGGAGIRASGASTVRVSGCEIDDASLAAIALHGETRATVEGSTLSSDAAGVLCWGDGVKCELRGCRIGGRSLHALLAGAGADVVVEDCEGIPSEGAQCGLFARGRARVSTRSCRFSGNPGHGAAIQDEATLISDGDTFENNGNNGVLGAGRARIEIKAAKCRGNALALGLVGEASALVDGGVFSQNPGPGIAVEGEASLRARGARVSDNESYGVAVVSSGDVLLEDLFVARNTADGILAAESSRPRIERCRVYANGGSGIVFAGSARGAARDNDCDGNEEQSVDVRDDAAPELERNACASSIRSAIGALADPRAIWQKCVALAVLSCLRDGEEPSVTMTLEQGAAVWSCATPGGDQLTIVFGREGVLVAGFDHESPTSPYALGRIRDGVLVGLPPGMRGWLALVPTGESHPGRFDVGGPDELTFPDATFCAWRPAGSPEWAHGPVGVWTGTGDDDADGAGYLIGLLDGGTFVEDDGFEEDFVQRVFAHEALRDAALRSACEGASAKAARGLMKRLGYGGAYPYE